MLARGAFCRLAADVPKTSTHDLPRISQLLRTSLFARHGASQPTVGAIARAFRATILQGRRAYATSSATEPTARVKREVKKAVAAKKPAKKTAKKTAPANKATPRKPKTAAKTKAAPKKPAKRARKEPTEEQKTAHMIKELKKKALLRGSPKRAGVSSWIVFVSEALKPSGSVNDSQLMMKEAAVKFKNLTPSEREHYNQLAKTVSEERAAVYNKWILSHTREEINAANNARAALKRKLGLAYRPDRLNDVRTIKAHRTNPYALFSAQRLTSGDFQAINSRERVKLVAKEWKALAPSEKKVFQDQFEIIRATAAKAAA